VSDVQQILLAEAPEEARPESDTIYVIMAQNYEYNDEYYYFTDGGEALDWYPDREAANVACALKNAAWMENDYEEDSWDHQDVGEGIYYVVPLQRGTLVP
jgi:hypothetical protein